MIVIRKDTIKKKVVVIRKDEKSQNILNNFDKEYKKHMNWATNLIHEYQKETVKLRNFLGDDKFTRIFVDSPDFSTFMLKNSDRIIHLDIFFKDFIGYCIYYNNLFAIEWILDNSKEILKMVQDYFTYDEDMRDMKCLTCYIQKHEKTNEKILDIGKIYNCRTMHAHLWMGGDLCGYYTYMYNGWWFNDYNNNPLIVQFDNLYDSLSKKIIKKNLGIKNHYDFFSNFVDPKFIYSKYNLQMTSTDDFKMIYNKINNDHSDDYSHDDFCNGA